MKPRYKLYLTTTALAAMLATPAIAQTTTPGTSTPTAAESDSGIEEIIVTAQKRTENLQDVPISITAITARTLERSGITGINAIAQLTPALNFTSPVSQLSPILRGVGTAAAAIGNSASVATYVDGVYIPAMSGSLFEFNNIERIEVLKGPQGTLFGRNSTGGVINVVTKDPSFDSQLHLKAGYGNYNTVEGSVYGSTSLGTNVAVDVAGFYRNQGRGWSFNQATGQRIAKQGDFLIRSKLLLTPSENTRIVLAGDYAYTAPANAALNVPAYNALTIGGVPAPARFWDVNQNFYIPAKARQGGGSLTIDQDLGDVKLRSITAYRKNSGFNIIDLDGTQKPIIAIRITERSNTFTQEVQLLSDNKSNLNWIVGAFYLKGVARSDPFNPPPFQLFAKQNTESISGFAQGTYAVAENTNVTAGLRYTSDQYIFNTQIVSNAGVASPPAATRVNSQARVTWRLALDHKFGEHVLGYLSYNRGFRSGTFNLTDANVPALRPEILDAVEAGLKTDLLDKRLRVNVAAYHYNFKDIQIARADGTSQQTLNASSAKIYGLDADITAAVTDNLILIASGAYVHGRYGSFLNAPISTPRPTGGNIVVVGNATGNNTIRTPTFSYNLGINQVIPSDIGKFNVSANWYHNSGYATDPDNRLKQRPYGLLSGSVSWTSSDDHYEVSIWAKNLTNAEYYSHLTETGPGDVGIPAAPRTFGISVGVKL